MAERIYFLLMVIPLIFSFVGMFSSGYYSGEFEHFEFSIQDEELFFLFLINFVSLAGLFFLYLGTKKRKVLLLKRRIFFNGKKAGVFFLIVLSSHFAFVMLTGVGRVGSLESSPYSFVFSMLNLSYIYPLYHLLARKSAGILYWVNVVFYCALQIAIGWTGFILIIVILEISIFFSRVNLGVISRWSVVIFLPFLLFFTGAKVYQYLYPLKFQIRDVPVEEITYTESLTNLSSRLTYFPVSVAAYERQADVVELFVADNVVMKEIKGLFRPISPRFLMEDKEFRPLNNNVKQAFYPEIEVGTSTDIGLAMYWLMLFLADPLQGVIWFLLSCLLIFFTKCFFDTIEQWKGQLDILYFLLLMKFSVSASLEVVFGYGYLLLVYILPVLFFCGALSVGSNKYWLSQGGKHS